MSRTALAFMSYVNLDDQHEQGRLTRFREYLSGEVRMQTGESFDIFQDRKDIAWGQQWQKRIDESLDAVTFLIPIITPGFFKSEACRDELERFLKREEELGRGDLILPVYYVKCPVLQDKAKREHDTLAQVIAARQYADWRDLRFKSFDSDQVREHLANMAEQIVAALERSQVEASRQQPEKDSATSISSNTFTKTGRGDQSIAQGDGAIGTQINNYYAPPQTESKLQPVPAVKVEPLTVIVDQHNRGDYVTITEALEAVKAGTRILVRPGLYKESIVIDKAVEIIGDGERDEIVLEALGRAAVVFVADMGRIANLTLRQTGGDGYCCVDIARGRLELDDCDISGQSQIGVLITTGSNPTLRRNRIHDNRVVGISVSDNGQGTLEENDIFANVRFGVEIKTGGNATLRRNRIHDGKVGILTTSNDQGVIEDNEIFFNAAGGVFIWGGDNLILRRNHIFRNGRAGISVRKDLFEGGGGGIFEDNDLRGNAEGAWDIEPGCKANVQRRGNKE